MLMTYSFKLIKEIDVLLLCGQMFTLYLSGWLLKKDLLWNYIKRGLGVDTNFSIRFDSILINWGLSGWLQYMANFLQLMMYTIKGTPVSSLHYYNITV